jgi:energy-coupling factor transporter ATP-binding protein EcfA2
VPEAAAEWHDVSVRYPYADRPAVGPVAFSLAQGECLLLLGPSGSGKSTLLATLTGLVPASIPATVEGGIRLFGRSAAERSPAAWADTVAHLFQDADRTLCGMNVQDEIAFALENRGLPEACIRGRVAAAMRAVGLPADGGGRRTMTLSGGEKQLVALAAVLAQDAPVLVVDEPTAHLAPAATARLRRLLNGSQGARSVLIVDHRLDDLIGQVDRVAVLGHRGRLIAEGPPAAVFGDRAQALAGEGIWLPLAARLHAALKADGLAEGPPILDLARAVRGLGRCRRTARTVARLLDGAGTAAAPRGVIVARLEDAACAPFRGPAVLEGITLEVRSGEVLGILGANGAGKSTLGAALAGILPLRAGRRSGPPGGVAFQNPEAQFVGGSVEEEIAGALGLGSNGVAEVLAAWDLADLRRRRPFELSQGQKRRLALASLTAGDRWPLVVLDEPTAGLDARGAATIERHVRSLAARGRALALITHDMDLALRLCERAVVLGQGRVLAAGPVRELLRDPDLLRTAGLAPPAVAPLLAWSEQAC